MLAERFSVSEDFINVGVGFDKLSYFIKIKKLLITTYICHETAGCYFFMTSKNYFCDDVSRDKKWK